jgi:RNA recognition motif-containing protein
MSRAHSVGKRNREVNRDLKKRQKAERLRRNRELRAREIDPDLLDPSVDVSTAGLPDVKLEDVVISVAPRSRREDFGPTKLFVGGLSPTTDAAAVRTFFAPFGELVDAIVLVNHSTGHSRGFGFVTYRSSMDANQAIAGTDGAELDGHRIRVNRAEARPGRF